MNDDRIPIALLTGFLGSGKTTLLNAWLRDEELANAAVVVNEFGDVGIDHSLIASSNDDTIELTTGCLCCTVRGDLVDALGELAVKRTEGRVRQFDRVVIETTGLADPGPVIQALMTIPVAARYRLSQVTTTIDAVLGVGTIERHWEARKQVAVADDIVVTKTDLSSGVSSALAARLHELNPGADIRLSSFQRVAAPYVRERRAITDPSVESAYITRWLNAAAYADDQTAKGPAHRSSAAHWNRDITSFCLDYAEPLEWAHVANWLDALVIAHGDNLLRVKGILNIVGTESPIVVHAVQRLFHPPFALREWGANPRRSQIVFVTDGLGREFVADVFDTIRRRASIR